MNKTCKIVALLVVVCMMAVMLVSCGGGGNNTKKDDGKRTYNLAMVDFPTNWNPHIYETATDATILDYISEGFYTFDYNETKDGYQLVCAMAEEEPVDVTADYVGRYGIEEGDTAKVWKLKLRSDLKWEDGTPIKAGDFVTSMKLLLDPIAHNYRADSYYKGSGALYNARNYFYQNQTVIDNENSEDGDSMKWQIDELVANEAGQYINSNGSLAYIGLKTGYAWLSGDTLEDYKSYMGEVYTELEALADKEGFVPATEATLAKLAEFTTSATWGYETMDQLGYYLSFTTTYGDADFEDVGVFNTNDTDLYIAYAKPLSGFYLKYNLSSTWLVNERLYKQCESIRDGVYNNTYGTTAATTISYGPYKLTSFENDKQFTFAKNNYWYGYALEENEGLYQTTNIQYDKVAEASTRLEMFLQGKLDSYGLTGEDMKDYQKSKYTYFTDGESTFFIAMNPDKTALEENQAIAGEDINKTILTVLEFRQAISFALDRMAFCLAVDPTSNAAFAVFSDIIISDPDAGTPYRTTDAAKQAMLDFWGLGDAVGETYETVDEAIASITGYNLAMAQNLFNEAYDKAIAEGLMDEDDKVEIIIGIPNGTSQFYNKGYEFLTKCYTEAVVGTKLEGKLTFKVNDTLGNGFADALRDNTVDMLFGVGWQGAALDPYGLISAYTDPQYQYDSSWKTTTEQIGVVIDGTEWFASVYDWSMALGSEDITLVDKDKNTMKFNGSPEADPAVRLDILAKLENAILEKYNMIPLIGDTSANLKGMQIKYYTEDYVYGVGRGGLKYITYNYTDYEWENFVKSNGGELNYK